jgi:hypothetical protein
VTARDTLPTPADLFGQSDFVHIAAHAWVDDQAPWRSGIELGAGEAGWLRAGDIARARTPLRLAVLSGCETAAGRILNGEGVLGLTAAFLAGGSGAVVASLWPVDDDATARLMGCFYRELAGGSPAATALTRAQRALQARARTRHPFYWAGFVLVGDGDMSINLSRKNTGWRRLAAAAAGGAAIVIALLGRDRDRSRPRSDQPAGSRGQAGGGGESIPAPARVIPRRRRRLTR